PRHPYTLQAAIAGVHARAERAEDTDWAQIVSLYELLLEEVRTSIVALNHAVAVAMRDGPREGLRLLDGISRSGELDGEHLFHAARADLWRREGFVDEAVSAYDRAISLVTNEPERRFLVRRRAGVKDGS